MEIINLVLEENHQAEPNLSIKYHASHLFCFLDVLGLHCSAQGLLWLQHAGLAAPQHVGSQFPNQRLNLRPLHWKADS